jgi:hypothetical protein
MEKRKKMAKRKKLQSGKKLESNKPLTLNTTTFVLSATASQASGVQPERALPPAVK